MANADWYFDFISPFAYLQSEQLHTLGPAVRRLIVPCVPYYSRDCSRYTDTKARPKFPPSARLPTAMACGAPRNQDSAPALITPRARSAAMAAAS